MKKEKNLIKIRKAFLAEFDYRFNRRYWQNIAFDRLLYACIYAEPAHYLSKVPNQKLSTLDKIVFLCIAYFVRKLGRINDNAYFINFVKYHVII